MPPRLFQSHVPFFCLFGKVGPRPFHSTSVTTLLVFKLTSLSLTYN